MGERNMSSTKKTLIKASAIFSIISGVIVLLSVIVMISNFSYLGNLVTGYGNVSSSTAYALNIVLISFETILAICSITGGSLLLKFISPKNQKSPKLASFYKAGCVLVIIGAMGLSLSALLLYISFGMKETTANAYFNDSEVNSIQSNPATNAQQQQQDENIKKQIEILRDMKAKGEITDEEFKAIMFDIIKKS